MGEFAIELNRWRPTALAQAVLARVCVLTSVRAAKGHLPAPREPNHPPVLLPRRVYSPKRVACLPKAANDCTHDSETGRSRVDSRETSQGR
jgi:hypothetical protein